MNEEIILTKEQLGKFIDFLEKEKKSVVDPEALKGLKKLFSSLKDGDSTPDLTPAFEMYKLLDILKKWSAKQKAQEKLKKSAKVTPIGSAGEGEGAVTVPGFVKFDPTPPEVRKMLKQQAIKERKQYYKKCEDSLQSLGDVLKRGGSGGVPANLTNIRCDEPIISSMAGAMSGFVPRYLYHISPLSATSKLKQQLKNMNFIEDVVQKKDPGLLRRIIKKVGIKKTVFGAGLLATLAILTRPEVVKVPGKVASKPLDETKKLSDLIGDFTEWSNGIKKVFVDANYVLDPCFAASFLVGATALSLTRAVTGKTLKAFETQRLLKEIDKKTFKNSEEFLKYVARFDEGNEFFKKSLDFDMEIFSHHTNIASKIKDLPAIEQWHAVFYATGRKTGGKKIKNVRTGEEAYDVPPIDANRYQELIELISEETTALRKIKQEQDQIFEQFVKKMQVRVVDSLAAQTDFFKVFDAIPGAKITSDQVGYLNRVTKEAGEEFLESFKSLDEARKVFIDSLENIKNFDPSVRRRFLKIESKLDNAFSINQPDLGKELWDVEALSRAERNFLMKLDDEVYNSMKSLYRKKMDALDKIDRYETTVKIADPYAKSRDGSLKWQDTNDLINSTLTKSSLKGTALGKVFQASIPLDIMAAGGALIAGYVLYKNAVGDLEKQLSRENIAEIHAFLNSPTPEQAKKLETTIASVYDELATIASEEPGITYEELMATGLEEAVSKTTRELDDRSNLRYFSINVDNYEGTNKSIATILAFEYLKNPSVNDGISPRNPDTRIKPTDVANPVVIRNMAKIFRKEKLVMTESEYRNLFRSSYARVKEVLEGYARKEEIELPKSTFEVPGEPLPKDDTDGEAAAQPEQPEKQQDGAPGSRDDLKIKRSAVEAAGKKFIPNIEKIGKEQGVNPALFAALIFTESSWKPAAESPAGAVGLSQLMPKTAQQYGVKDRTDPVQNITGGMKFLKNGVKNQLQQAMSQHKELDWNKLNEQDKLRLILYAYNWGAPNLISTSNGFDLRGKNPKYANRTNKQLMKAIDDWYTNKDNPQTGGKNYATKILTKAKEYGYNPGMPAFFNPSGEIKEYKLNDLRKLVTEVMSEQEQFGYDPEEVERNLKKARSEKYGFEKMANPLPDRTPAERDLHRENSVIKATSSVKYGMPGYEYYTKIVDYAQRNLPFGDNAYSVEHENLSDGQPVILDKKSALKFYEFLERWTNSVDEFGKIALNDKTATWDAIPGASDRSLTSQHKHGNALDLKVPASPKSWKKFGANTKHLKFKTKVLDIALAVGFRGFGFGSNVLHIDTRKNAGWWIYNHKNKFDFLNYDILSIVPVTESSFRELVYIAPGSVRLLDRAVAKLTGKRSMREMKKEDLLEIISEVIKENSGQGYGKYPYDHVSTENEPAQDYIEEWKALSLNLVRDETRNTAVKIAKILVKDLELFEDVLDLAGQNQSIGVEILRKLKQFEEKA